MLRVDVLVVLVEQLFDLLFHLLFLILQLLQFILVLLLHCFHVFFITLCQLALRLQISDLGVEQLDGVLRSLVVLERTLADLERVLYVLDHFVGDDDVLFEELAVRPDVIDGFQVALD